MSIAVLLLALSGLSDDLERLRKWAQCDAPQLAAEAAGVVRQVESSLRPLVWKDATGIHQVTASLVDCSFENDILSVTLRREDRTQVVIPGERLGFNERQRAHKVLAAVSNFLSKAEGRYKNEVAEIAKKKAEDEERAKTLTKFRELQQTEQYLQMKHKSDALKEEYDRWRTGELARAMSDGPAAYTIRFKDLAKADEVERLWMEGKLSASCEEFVRYSKSIDSIVLDKINAKGARYGQILIEDEKTGRFILWTDLLAEFKRQHAEVWKKR